MAAEKPTPPFDTFVFDVDGTLLDTLDDLVVLTKRQRSLNSICPRAPARRSTPMWATA